MTELEDLQQENLKLERILKRRNPLFAIIIIGLVVCLGLLGLLYAQTAKVVRQNVLVAQQNRNYTRCIAEVFVKSQTEKVTSLDLNHCSTTTEPNPTYTTPDPTAKASQSTQQSNPQSRPQTQPPPPQSNPQPSSPPKSCTNVLGIVCL